MVMEQATTAQQRAALPLPSSFQCAAQDGDTNRENGPTGVISLNVLLAISPKTPGNPDTHMSCHRRQKVSESDL
jgi:hypothetical protein